MSIETNHLHPIVCWYVFIYKRHISKVWKNVVILRIVETHYQKSKMMKYHSNFVAKNVKNLSQKKKQIEM